MAESAIPVNDPSAVDTSSEQEAGEGLGGAKNAETMQRQVKRANASRGRETTMVTRMGPYKNLLAMKTSGRAPWWLDSGRSLVQTWSKMLLKVLNSPIIDEVDNSMELFFGLLEE